MNKNLKEKILKLKNEGKTYNEIQKELNCSKGVIAFHLSKSVRDKQKKRLQKRRKNIKNDLRIRFGGKCTLCGYSKCLAALDFHHIDPKSKVHAIAHLVKTTSLALIETEVNKCILICANCHRELHYHEKMGSIEGIEPSSLAPQAKALTTELYKVGPT